MIMAPTLHDLDIMARTLYGEARGEGRLGLRAVAHVIMNRVRDPRWPDNPASVCLQKFQFSCWNAAGEQSQKSNLQAIDFDRLCQSFCYQAAVGVALDDDEYDITGGANHYLTKRLYASDKKPSWADPGKVTAAIKRHIFLKL